MYALETLFVASEITPRDHHHMHEALEYKKWNYQPKSVYHYG
jgi:hypothetical protein